MNCRRSLRPAGRFARLGGLGLLAGAIAGAAAAGDIERSYGNGRIAPSAVSASSPAAAATFAPRDDEFGLAASHGYTLAASLRFTRREECRTVALEMRSGCLDYIAERASGALEPAGDDLL